MDCAEHCCSIWTSSGRAYFFPDSKSEGDLPPLFYRIKGNAPTGLDSISCHRRNREQWCSGGHLGDDDQVHLNFYCVFACFPCTHTLRKNFYAWPATRMG